MRALPSVYAQTCVFLYVQVVPLENESLEFDDGSFTADIPRKRLSELFHVTQDVVSQAKLRPYCVHKT